MLGDIPDHVVTLAQPIIRIIENSRASLILSEKYLAKSSQKVTLTLALQVVDMQRRKKIIMCCSLEISLWIYNDISLNYLPSLSSKIICDCMTLFRFCILRIGSWSSKIPTTSTQYLKTMYEGWIFGKKWLLRN